MSKKSWSLANRLTLWFTGMTVVLVGLIAAASTWFVLGATSREFEAVATEGIDELRAIFRNRTLTREAMGAEVELLSNSHPGMRLGWRLWNRDTGEIWGEFGDTWLLPAVGDQPKEPWIRLREVPFEGYGPSDVQGPLWIGMLVDGRGRLFALKRYGTIAGAILLLSGVGALTAGVLFGRKTANLLERVANRVQATEPGDEPKWQEENPPVEIERVADALSQALKRAHGEQERATFLIAGVAHELRSPIQNLLGQTEVLLMRDRSVEEYREVLESHSEEIQDLAREIDNLVTFCAHTSNQAGGSREHFDLGEELELRMPREAARARRRGVELWTKIAGDLEMVGDREALLLVLRNLIGNAISFAPDGSRVEVVVEDRGAEVLCSVDDAGPGVPVENRERIFEPFGRGHDAPGTRTGFGLGLALSRTAIVAQGGELGVGDSPLGGARFEATMPKRPPGTGELDKTGA